MTKHGRQEGGMEFLWRRKVMIGKKFVEGRKVGREEGKLWKEGRRAEEVPTL
jgi:hypothetical protein